MPFGDRRAMAEAPSPNGGSAFVHPRRFDPRPRRTIWARAIRWLTVAAMLALVGDRVAIALDSPMLGVAGAGLALLIGIAFVSATRSDHAGR